MFLESFIIDVKKRSALIESCEMTVPIDERQREQFLTRKLLASQKTMISPHSEAMVSLVLLLLSNNCDFLFHPATQTNLILFTCIVDHQILKVLVRNISNETLCIPRRYKLGYLIDIAYNNCFLTNTQSTLDAAIFSPL